MVLFLVDDLGWADNDLGYSQQFAQQRGDTDAFFETPNLRSMADEGMSFTQAYASSPVCSPTRASLMLGQSPAKHRITQFIGGPDTPGFQYTRSLPGGATTIAEAMRDHGYRTGYAGKWHLGSLPTQHGFQENYGGGSQGLPSSWFANSNGGFGWATGLPNDGPAFAGEYLTDRLTRDAVDFIDTAVGNNEPFFLDMSHYGVHVPFAAPQPLIDKYVAKLDAGSYAQFDNLTASQRLEVATYAAMTEAVDSSLGAIRGALDDNQIADDTIVVFFSDNGGLATPDFGNFAADDMNAPLRNGKGTLYEGGSRVPMVVTGPGVAQGSNDQAVIGHDLYTTILNATGITLPNQHNDGVDLAPLLAGGQAIDRGDKPVMIHYPHLSNQGGRPGGVIIDGDWKLIQSYEHGGIELYNLANDLGETTDLEGDELMLAERMRVDLHLFLAATNAQRPAGFNLDTQYAGAPLEVINPSFEVDVLPDNTSGDPSNTAARTPTGWSWVGGVELRNGGVANPNENTLLGPDFSGTDGDGLNGAMDGPQHIYFGSLVDANNTDVTGQRVGLEQTLSSTYTRASDYTLRFAAAGRSDQSVFVDGLVRVLAGSTVIAEYQTPHDANGLFREYQFGFSSLGMDPTLFDLPLTIQLLRDIDGGKVSYDHIRLYQDLRADLDGDGFVGINDLNIILAEWNNSVPLENPAADPSGDGFVGISDLGIILVSWNVGTPLAIDGLAIPEPNTAACMLSLAALMLPRRLV